jgi:hypothetical protein
LGAGQNPWQHIKEGTAVLLRVQPRQAEQLLLRQGRGICWHDHVGATIGESRHDATGRKRITAECFVEAEDGKLVHQIRGHRKILEAVAVEGRCYPCRVQMPCLCEFKVSRGILQSLVLFHNAPLFQVLALLT